MLQKSDDGVAKYKLTADSDTLDKLDEALVPLVMAEILTGLSVIRAFSRKGGGKEV